MNGLLPAKVNFTIWEGATWRKTITVLSGDSNSVPRDLTGYISEMVVRPAEDVAPVYTLSTANGQIVLGGAAGTVALYISATDTLTFEAWAPGVYELTVTADAGIGDTDSLLWGQFRVRGIA